MKATEFVSSIALLRMNNNHFDHFANDIYGEIENEGNNLSTDGLVKEFLRRRCLRGTYFDKKENSVESKNEIENLLNKFSNSNFFYLFRDITLLEGITLVDDDLFAFANLDGYLCYNTENEILWVDFDTQELYCKVSKSPDLFLDCMYELASNNINLFLSKEELYKKLVAISGTKESEEFFKFLLAIDDF